jgi:hypothetical protein
LSSDEGRGVAAIRFGEVLATCDPEISEWGNPVQQTCTIQRLERGCTPAEVKHLSKRRKRKQSDSLSSGERNGTSLNQPALVHAGVARERRSHLLNGVGPVRSR